MDTTIKLKITRLMIPIKEKKVKIYSPFTSEKQNSAQLKHIGKPSELDRDNLNQHNYEIDSISELAPYVNSNKNLEAKFLTFTCC